MQKCREGIVTILSEDDEDLISRKLQELMEVVWDTFQRRRLVLRPPQRKRRARLVQSDSDDGEQPPLDSLF